MTMNSVSDMIPSSVYQAFPPHLLGRAFYVQRTLSGLGAVRSPSFLCHPLVTPSSIRALSASGGFLLALRPQSFQLAYSQPLGHTTWGAPRRADEPSLSSFSSCSRYNAGVPRALLEDPSRIYPEWRSFACVFVSWTEQRHMHGPLDKCISKAVSVCMLLCATNLGGYLSEGTAGNRLMLFRRVRIHDKREPEQ